MNQKQRETLSEISPTGLMLNEGTPCECGGDAYTTSKRRAFSDSMVYTHNCTECGNEFSTWTEG